MFNPRLSAHVRKAHQLLSTITISLMLLACNSTTYDNDTRAAFAAERPKTADELRAELLEKEQSNASEYLTVEGKYWRNLVDELVLEGDVTNNATLARFKDPVLTVSWYSQTETLIGQESYKVYEYVTPHQSAHFKLKTNAPTEVKSVGFSISGAETVR